MFSSAGKRAVHLAGMALCPLANFQLVAGVGDQGSAADQAYLDAADAAVKNYIGWNPERVTDSVKYLDGTGVAELWLPGLPVNPSVTEVRVDVQGGYGQISGSFDSTTVITAGTNYFFDAATNSLRMWRVPSQGWWWGPNGAQSGPSNYFAGLSTWGIRPAYWPRVPGCVMVTYSNGYTTIPNDLRQAVIELATYLRLTTRLGGLVQNSVNYIDTSAGLQFAAEAFGALQLPALGSARGLLSAYTDRQFFPTGIR